MARYHSPLGKRSLFYKGDEDQEPTADFQSPLKDSLFDRKRRSLREISEEQSRRKQQSNTLQTPPQRGLSLVNKSRQANCLNKLDSELNKSGGLILFVNGLTQVRGLRHDSFMPKPFKSYWYKSNRKAAKTALSSENALFINGEYYDKVGDTSKSYVSSAEARFWAGYACGAKHYLYLKNSLNYKTKSKKLYMVSHSQGGAFSEGLAQYLYDKAGSAMVHLAIHLQPSSAAFIPMKKESVKYRIGFYTQEDPIADKFNQRLAYQDYWIEEAAYEEKYGIIHEHPTTHYVYRGDRRVDKFVYSTPENQYTRREAHWAHQHRPEAIWNTISVIIDSLPQ